ncbi:DsbA family oxidoreductase [Nocardiopsis nanhaiensis]
MRTTITVWADIRCPWCWISHRRLGAALARVEEEQGDREFTVLRRSFLLEPTGPDHPARTVREAALTSWGVDTAGWEALRGRAEASGRAEGLAIGLDGVRNLDSRAAHRLIKLATASGTDSARAWELSFAALLEHHEDLADPVALRRLGVELGLDSAEVDATLRSDGFASEVAADHRAAAELGVHTVPTVLYGDRTLQGDRSVDELVAFLSPEGVLR